MDIELHAYYVQDKTGTLYEVVDAYQKTQRIAVQNVATLNITTHTWAWAKLNLRHLRSPVSEEQVEDAVPAGWAA